MIDCPTHAGYDSDRGERLATCASAASAPARSGTEIERELRASVRLARLMIDHGVGVSTTDTLEVQRVDSDYFAEE